MPLRRIAGEYRKSVNDPALRPKRPAKLGPMMATPGLSEWQAPHSMNFCSPRAASPAACAAQALAKNAATIVVVMRGLVPRIHDLVTKEDVDGRDRPGHEVMDNFMRAPIGRDS